MGFNYFEEADAEILPETFVKYDWNQIKEEFTHFQQIFFDKMRQHLNA